jgi:hypothetical protein
MRQTSFGIDLETGPTATWLWTELRQLGLPVICIDARHAKAALKTQLSNDAVGIARIMQCGWYKEVRVKMIGAQSLGHEACEAKWAAQSQGCCCPKACRHSASDVDRRQRVQMIIKTGCKPTCLGGQRIPSTSGNHRPCWDAGVGAVAPGFAMLILRHHAEGVALPRREQWTGQVCSGKA